MGCHSLKLIQLLLLLNGGSPVTLGMAKNFEQTPWIIDYSYLFIMLAFECLCVPTDSAENDIFFCRPICLHNKFLRCFQ